MKQSRSKPKASPTQARFLAKIFADQRVVGVCEASTATVHACVRNGWLRFNGINEKSPGGSPIAQHEISSEGLSALEVFLCEARWRALGRGESGWAA